MAEVVDWIYSTPTAGFLAASAVNITGAKIYVNFVKSLDAWKNALEEGGVEPDVKQGKPLSDVRLSSPTTVLPMLILFKLLLQRNTKTAIFITPTIFYVIFMILTILPWYTDIFLAEFFWGAPCTSFHLIFFDFFI